MFVSLSPISESHCTLADCLATRRSGMFFRGDSSRFGRFSVRNPTFLSYLVEKFSSHRTSLHLSFLPGILGIGTDGKLRKQSRIEYGHEHLSE